MEDAAAIRQLIERHEGSGPMREGQFLLYDDATGHEIVPGSRVIGNPTFGYGYNVYADGVPPDIVGILRDRRIALAESLCRALYPNWDSISGPRRTALTDMAYCLGGRLVGFHDMNVAVIADDWPEVAHQAESSAWGRHEAPERAADDAALLRNG